MVLADCEYNWLSKEDNIYLDHYILFSTPPLHALVPKRGLIKLTSSFDLYSAGVVHVQGRQNWLVWAHLKPNLSTFRRRRYLLVDRQVLKLFCGHQVL